MLAPNKSHAAHVLALASACSVLTGFASFAAASALDAATATHQEQAESGGDDEASPLSTSAQARADRNARDPIFRADLDVSFTYAAIRGPSGPQIYGGSLHPRFGLRVWSTPGAAGRIDIGLMAGYRVEPYPDRHDDLGLNALQQGSGHRPFVWGSLGHSFYFGSARKVAMGVHGMLGWSNYTLSYTLRDDANQTARPITLPGNPRNTHNILAAAIHGHMAFAFGPRAGLLLNGTYTIPTEPVVAPWSVGIGLNVKLR